MCLSRAPGVCEPCMRVALCRLDLWLRGSACAPLAQIAQATAASQCCTRRKARCTAPLHVMHCRRVTTVALAAAATAQVSVAGPNVACILLTHAGPRLAGVSEKGYSE